MAAAKKNPSVSTQATADSHNIGSHTVGRLSADSTNAPVPHDGIGPPELEPVYFKPAEVTHIDDAPGNTHPPVDKKICGIRRAWFLLVLIAATCIVIAVSVALGVTFARKNKSE